MQRYFILFRTKIKISKLSKKRFLPVNGAGSPPACANVNYLTSFIGYSPNLCKIIKSEFHNLFQDRKEGISYAKIDRQMDPMFPLLVFDINNLWVSDITYFRLGDAFYYLTFIEDVYSRRILGSIAYPTLQARANLYALKTALEIRNIPSYANLIHHSDRGVQYTSNEYVNALERRSIKISMCDSVYENTHIERVNGIIKNEYLHHWTIDDFSTLKQKLKLAVYLYNNERPHWNLGKMTPVGFENYIKDLPIKQRKGLHMYTTDKEEKDLINVDQLCLFD